MRSYKSFDCNTLCLSLIWKPLRFLTFLLLGDQDENQSDFVIFIDLTKASSNMMRSVFIVLDGESGSPHPKSFLSPFPKLGL